MSNKEQDIQITYQVEEFENKNEYDFNIYELMCKIENMDEIYNPEISHDNDLIISQMLNYNDNLTVKQLLIICEYYGFAKEIKMNKFNKEQIINFLVSFESDPNNSDIVCKRQNMWFYINELKNDKFMKKFVLW
jgi:hypothetical protein